MNTEHITDLSTSPARCSHFTFGNPSHFSTLLLHILHIIYVSWEENEQQLLFCSFSCLLICCLVLPITCIALVLRLGHATEGARLLIRTCWGLRQRLVATWAEFQHSVVYYATDQCRKRLEACINADSGHSERLLWHCLPDIPVAAHQNRFFS